jgi:outer membrane receptor protein involved in Fe transport
MTVASGTPAARVVAALLALLILAPEALAQRPAGAPSPEQMAAMAGRIAGSVVDAETGDPLALATVALYQAGEFVTGAATGPDGTFEVGPLRPGAYEVRVSSVGYATHRVEEVAVRAGSPVDLGTVRLAAATAQLGEAEVVAERDFVEVRADRTVYNVSDQPVTTGGSAIEVLQTLPSLEVDLEGTISLRGNQNVAIHMNGRPVPMRGDQLTAFLRQLPSDQVERVEVLPNPSARYEADSMAGIVNIVLKQGVSRGLSGGINAGAGTAPSGSLSGNIAYQEGRVDVFASYGFRYDDWSADGASWRHTPASSEPFLDQELGNSRSNLSHFLNTSLDYTLRPGLVLNASGMLSQRGGDSENATFYRFLDADRDLIRDYARTSQGDVSGFNSNATLGLKRTWTPQRHELSGEVRYSFNRSEDEDLFTQTAAPGVAASLERNEVTNSTANATAQLDYVRPLGEGRVEVGARANLRRIDTDRLGVLIDPASGDETVAAGRTNAFDYSEDVYAAYLQGAHPLGPVEVQLGVRMEHARTDFLLATTGVTFDRSYTDLFPSAFVVYSPWTGGTLRAGYSRRINRPWPQQLNPFETFDDPLNVRRGNPDLQPEYIDSFELTASQFLPFGTVSVTPFYRRTTNVIRPRFLFDPETNVSTFTQENLDVDDSYGADVTLAARFGEQLSGFVSGSVFRTQTSAGSIETGLGTDAIAWSVRGNLSTRLAPGLTAQLFGFYRAPMTSIDGRMSGFKMTSIGLRQQFMDQRASLNLRVNDPFNISRFEFSSTRPDFFQEGFRDPNMRRVDVTFTYTFGQVSQRQRRQRAQEDVPDVPQDQFGF